MADQLKRNLLLSESRGPSWTEICVSLSVSNGPDRMARIYETAKQALWSNEFERSAILFAKFLKHVSCRDNTDKDSDPSKTPNTNSNRCSSENRVLETGYSSDLNSDTSNDDPIISKEENPILGGASSSNCFHSKAAEQSTEAQTLPDTFWSHLDLSLYKLNDLGIDDEYKEELAEALNIISAFSSKYLSEEHFDSINVMSTCAALYLRLGLHAEALHCAKVAVTMNPDSILAQETFENMCCHLVERWHFVMLNDKGRNEAYQNGIQSALKRRGPKTKVCDVGCGTGLLGLIAASHPNCHEVYAIEKSKTMFSIAKDVLTSPKIPEKIRNKITLVNKMSTEMSVPADISGRMDILVTEIFDAGLFGEGIVPTLCHAWEQLLKGNSFSKRAEVIPGKAFLYFQAIESEDLRREIRFYPQSKLSRLKYGDLQLNCKVSHLMSEPYTAYELKNLLRGYIGLTKPFELGPFNFNDPEVLNTINEKGFHGMDLVDVTSGGTVDAIVAWFKLYLNDTATISTHPGGNGCWEQAVFPITPARLGQHRGNKITPLMAKLEVEQGDKLNITTFIKESYLKLNICEHIKRQGNSQNRQSQGKSIFKQTCYEDSEWSENGVYCLEPYEISALNNHVLYDLYYERIKQLLVVCGKDTQFFHINKGFSPLCLDALMLGYTSASVQAPSDLHTDLLSELATLNDIDPDCLTLFDEIQTLINYCGTDWYKPKISVLTNDPGFSSKEKDASKKSDESLFSEQTAPAAVFVFDVVDPDGPMLEHFCEQLSVLELACHQLSVIWTVPYCFHIYGMLVESDELARHSRVQSDENTLGFPVGEFCNIFSTRSHQGINMQTLKHTKLTEPFKMFTINLQRLLNPSLCAQKKSSVEQLWEQNIETEKREEQEFFSKFSKFTKTDNLSSGSGSASEMNSQPGQANSCDNVKANNFKTVNSICSSVPIQKKSQRMPASVEIIEDKKEDHPEAKKRKLEDKSDVKHSAAQTEEKGAPLVFNQGYKIKMPVVHSGKVTALVYWFQLDITSDHHISTIDPSHHWRQAAVMSHPKYPHSITAGESIEIVCELSNSAISFMFYEDWNSGTLASPGSGAQPL